MKLFLVAALLIASACAEPESDSEAKPWLAYGNYGYGYPAYGHTGYAGYGGYAGHYGYAGYPYRTNGYRHLWKRDTESEPEAKPDAWYSLYGHGLTYPYAHNAYAAGYPYAHATYAAPATTVGRYVAPYYNTYGLGYHHALGKREAESDSEAKPESWYNHYGTAYSYPYGNGYALPYARTYAPYGYGLRSYARWW